MSDLKSKLPDLNELGSMAGKLYKDVKASVCEIIEDYKLKHPPEAAAPEVVVPEAPVVKPTESAEKPADPAVKPADSAEKSE